ncbi:hypothetical protein ACFOGJ_09015 [Marinibaculum pumilum]|uniref:Uncharacterized protein n=1 Tax=Marinibaculum pumilum TaxID=1766165 RepID=A0ABV7KY93_9PROT
MGARDQLADLSRDAEDLYGAMHMLAEFGPDDVLPVYDPAALKEAARKLMHVAWAAQRERAAEQIDSTGRDAA